MVLEHIHDFDKSSKWSQKRRVNHVLRFGQRSKYFDLYFFRKKIPKFTTSFTFTGAANNPETFLGKFSRIASRIYVCFRWDFKLVGTRPSKIGTFAAQNWVKGRLLISSNARSAAIDFSIDHCRLCPHTCRAIWQNSLKYWPILQNGWQRRENLALTSLHTRIYTVILTMAKKCFMTIVATKLYIYLGWVKKKKMFCYSNHSLAKEKIIRSSKISKGRLTVELWSQRKKKS